jgi:alkanesulfonate monooxygenase SsuD/methylene tetrahydromethanopterin reductase-like flavin-dependent oxidoreductase (luciferase family)
VIWFALLQQPHPPLFFGGASPGALEMGARLCDVYAIYAEPLASTRDRIAQFRAQAAAFGRLPGFNVSVRPIIADTEGAAWEKANRILGAMNVAKGWRRQEEATGPIDNAGKRLMEFALESDIHDERQEIAAPSTVEAACFTYPVSIARAQDKSRERASAIRLPLQSIAQNSRPAPAFRQK